MGEHDTFTALDEVEQSNLQRMISSVETALAASTPDIRSVLERVLQNAKGRVDVLEKKFKDFQAERENRSRENAAIAALVERETALNEHEREEFAGFLTKDFFTKRDFSALEQFYAHTWDRLSEGGKDEMSHRVWEGIRRDEYPFSELPDSVREKEMERAYLRLSGSTIDLGSAERIPDVDKADFLRAYERGNRDEAGKVLERNSFKEHMFLSAESKSRHHADVARGNEPERGEIEKRIRTSAQPERVPKLDEKADSLLSGLKFEGAATGGIAATEIPAADSLRTR